MGELKLKASMKSVAAQMFIGDTLNQLSKKGYGPEVAIFRKILLMSELGTDEWEDIYKEIECQYPEKHKFPIRRD